MRCPRTIATTWGSRSRPRGSATTATARDSVAWHGDTIGRRQTEDTMVAIVSLGAARTLLLRPRSGGPASDSGRPWRPARDGRLVPAHLGARRAQDGATGGSADQRAVPAAQRPLVSSVDRFELVELPGLVEPWLERAVDPERAGTTTCRGWSRPSSTPCPAGAVGTEVQVVGAVVVGLQACRSCWPAPGRSSTAPAAATGSGCRRRRRPRSSSPAGSRRRAAGRSWPPSSRSPFASCTV